MAEIFGQTSEHAFSLTPWPSSQLSSQSYKMGLGGLHDSYFTFSYASPYVSRSFDQSCFLYSCSGFSKEDF